MPTEIDGVCNAVTEFKAILIGDDFDIEKDRLGFSHWQVTIATKSGKLVTEYSQGAAYRRFSGMHYRKKYTQPPSRLSVYDAEEYKQSIPTKPELIDVLASLAFDAQSVEYGGFEDWCSEFGYDTDSISALERYRNCCKIRGKLNAMFNLSELYEAFRDY